MLTGSELRKNVANKKEAFDGTMSKLTPLIGRIRGTDALIDKIVYRLYGLTEEEIDIVEGK